MKKQGAHVIKARPVRSILYVALLLTVCVIPFALAHRNSNSGRVAAEALVAANTNPAAVGTQADVPSFTGAVGASQPGYDARAFSVQFPSAVTGAGTQTSEVPKRSSRFTGVHRPPILPAPKAPQVVLYDQYDNPSNFATLSATFADLPNYSSDLADDFVVPAGQTWTVQSIDADGAYFNCPNNNCIGATDWNVFFYLDNGSGLPGAQVYSTTHQPVTHAGTTFTVNLPTPAVLIAGHYWVEMQANMTFNTEGEWGWTDRRVQSNSPAAWQNPGGAYCACPSWVPRILCIPNDPSPDQVFRLNGTIGTSVDEASRSALALTPASTPLPAVAPQGTPTRTPTPTATPGQCQLRVLIVHTELSGPPTSIRDQIAREQGVKQVDLFNAHLSTPTLQQLQQYDIVFAFITGGAWYNAVAMGDVLADYEDGGGVVVVGDYAWHLGTCCLLQGRWMVIYPDGYTPYTTTDQWNLDSYDTACITPSHPLMAGVSNLGANNRIPVTLTSGATAVAVWTEGAPAVAYKTYNGRTAVGINAPLGNYGQHSNDWGRVIVNAGKWQLNCGPLPTPTPTPTPGPCQLRVLIVYSDYLRQPTTLRQQIAAEQGVTQVDLFDAFQGTPTLCLLQHYDIVFAFSNTPWNDAVAMGNVLADYEDTGGVVAVGTAAWDQAGCWHLLGRWMAGGYSPYNSTYQRNFSLNTANITDPSHPLMAGVSSLSATYRSGVTLASGAAAVAVWTDGPPAVAFKTNDGKTAVGINAYLGEDNSWSGQWARVIVNAGKWLSNCGPTITSAISRKTHGSAGTFDIDLPLTGTPGVECRSGGATNDYQMIINFMATVTVGSASVTSGTGSVSSFTVSGPQVTVNLTGVTSVQRITVTLFNVNDGTHMGNVPVSMGVLIGDVNGNAIVNASDVSLTKSQVGVPVSGSNFREDVNANGLINSVDVALVKSTVGTALPP